VTGNRIAAWALVLCSILCVALGVTMVVHGPSWGLATATVVFGGQMISLLRSYAPPALYEGRGKGAAATMHAAPNTKSLR
jgi:hypothetical protein